MSHVSYLMSLYTARDTNKDQSYFLWGLSQEQLSRSHFPLGELTKEEVRALARRANLPVAEKPESMELCFVPTGSYVQFIQAYSQERGISLQNGEGEIVNENGDDGINVHMSTGVWVVKNKVDDNGHDGIRLDLANGNVIARNFVVSHDQVFQLGTPPAPTPRRTASVTATSCPGCPRRWA